MDVDTKQKWCESLESGRFKQGRTFLNNVTNETHCCLGVLCEIENIPYKDGQRLYTRNDGSEVSEVVREYGDASESGVRSGAMLTSKIQKLLGLSEQSVIKLANMNDNGISFKDISTYIQDNVS